MATAQEQMASLLPALASHLRIDREKAVQGLVDLLVKQPDQLSHVQDHIVKLLQPTSEDVVEEGNSKAPWEAAHGALMASAAMSNQGIGDDRFACDVAEQATRLLGHTEPRVRIEAGVALGALCAKFGPDLYGKYAEDAILESIANNLERDPNHQDIDKLKDKINIPADIPGQTKAVFHESAGWKTLETGSKALLEIVRGCGPAFAPFLRRDVVDLIFATLQHTNRFVRETGFYLCAEFAPIIEHGVFNEDADMSKDEFAASLCKQLARGLSDNWSQVRMAASVASRKFLLSQSEDARKQWFPLLVPRLCLNRYYVAEGVRIYSQETWRLLAGDHGKDLVEKYIDETVAYYISQTRADNHAVREAACACIAELGNKISPSCLEPHLDTMLQALREAFGDESWPVRDAACIASGRFIAAFPEQSRPQIDTFKALFIQHIGDNIWSVRENAAIALAKVVKAYGHDMFVTVLEEMRTMLPKAKEQSSHSHSHASLQNTTLFGVAPPVEVDGGARRIRYSADSVDPSHSDQQMYSCGSLAPKLKRGGGCMDCQYQRPQEPWELSDGCVYLVRELSSAYPKEVAELLPTLADVASVRHFKHHVQLLDTIWKQLPSIAEAVGKRPFKQYLELFLPHMHYSLTGNHRLSKASAEHCVQQLSKLLGPSIFRGRVELYDESFLPAFDAALQQV